MRTSTLLLWTSTAVISGSKSANAFVLEIRQKPRPPMHSMARRGKGDLKRRLEDSTKNMSPNDPKYINGGKGQEITGVSMPSENAIKGWEFGGGVRMACANVDNMFYAIQGDCPRCAFDLWKGDLLTDNEVWDNAPCIACPTCSTTFSLRTGAYGPPLKRSGLAGFVSGLTATSTNAGAYKNAKAFCISLDADGRVYCRDL